MKKIILVVALSLTFALGHTQILFTESSASLNINVSHGTNQFIGGVSFYDYDNDGWDDITYASQNGEGLYFYKNNSGTLTPVNLNFTDSSTDTRQINWVDIDNDGDNDLFVVSNNASNKLYENDGLLNFTDITVASGISTTVIKSWGASWGDYNNDGYLDLFLCNRDVTNRIEPNILYKNNGDNTFTNVNVEAGISNANHLSFCASFFDYNNDGWQDIYIANDRFITTNILYKNNGDGTFSDESAGSGTDLAIDAMSTTIDDYNNDGWLDIYVTNTASGNYFLKNNGNGTFTDVASANGTLFESVAWGAVFLDADNDMKQDLYVSGMRNGQDGNLPAAFYENVGGDMFEIPDDAGFNSDTAESYSNAIGDINNDGYPDITVINKSPIPNFLWLNNCESNITNNWLKVKLEGSVSNRMGIGSWIEIQVDGEKQYRYTLCGEGYTSQNSGTEFFGLADNAVVDYVKVVWLSGVEDVLYNVAANQTLQIMEGETLSVNRVLTMKDVRVYPTPVKSTFYIGGPSMTGKFRLIIYNLLGQHILELHNLQFNEPISLKALKHGGIYLATIVSEDGQITKKLP